jgi:Leucine-rich repeat (LRR) protein
MTHQENENFFKLLRSEDAANVALALALLEGNPQKKWQKVVDDYLAINQAIQKNTKDGIIAEEIAKLNLDSLLLDIAYIPPEIRSLHNLKKLWAKGCKLKTLPKEIGYLVNLEELNLEDNEIKSLPATIGRLNRLKQLHLINNHLIKLPRQIKKLLNLEELHVNINSTRWLPRQIKHLKKLKSLSATLDYTYPLTSQIGKLKNLETLSLEYFHYNNYTWSSKLKWFYRKRKTWLLGQKTLPRQFAQLKKLQCFHLHHEHIKDFPKPICGCENLRMLHLHITQIRNLPPCIGQLTQLEELLIYWLDFEKIPQEIKQLKQLKKISFFGSRESWTKSNYDTFKSWLPSDCQVEINIRVGHSGWKHLAFDKDGNSILQDLPPLGQ